MFATVINGREDGAPLSRTPDLPGQRVGDRCWFGTNLMHDIPLIRAFSYLSEITGNPSYRTAIDDYLDFFCHRCPNPVTGLFPWGEHACWHHFYDRAAACGDSLVARSLVHDHLRQAPVWFWRMIAARDPDIVVKFGEGLTGHLKDMESFDYSRHASIEEKKHSEGLFHFPRHGGFYIVDWAMAYRYGGDPKFLEWIDRMVKFHGANRSSANGLIKMDGREETWGGHIVATLPQSVSLALAIHEVLEALDELDETRAASWRRFADEVIGSALRALSTTDPLRTYCHFDFITGEGVDEQRILPLWYTSYGVQSLPELAVMLMGLYRYTGREELLTFSACVVDALSEQGPPAPPNSTRRHDYCGAVPAKDFGLAINLALEVWDQAEGTETGARAEELAIRLEKAIVDQMFFNDWLTAASGIYWYDTQMDPARIAYALVRLHDLRNRRVYGVKPDYQSR